jgi:hypothetical protein
MELGTTAQVWAQLTRLAYADLALLGAMVTLVVAAASLAVWAGVYAIVERRRDEINKRKRRKAGLPREPLVF